MTRLALCLLLMASCGNSGGALVAFSANAGGPSDAIAGSPTSFDNALGFHVTLNRASLHIGAVYLTDIEPSSGIGQEPCTIPSGQNAAYVAEVFAPPTFVIDLLSPELVPFSADGKPTGEGIAIQSKTAQVWLTSGDVNAAIDSTVILDVAGTAVQDGGNSYPFTGTITIGTNRTLPVTNSAQPGSNPICQQRIVQPIQLAILPTQGGTLTVRADPRPMFQTVDFSTLPLAQGSTSSFVIPDTNTGAGQSLYKGMLSIADVYQLSWTN